MSVDEDELDDDRCPWDWKTKYPYRVWFQISIELIWTLSILVFALLILFDGALVRATDCLNTCQNQTHYASEIFGVSIRSEAVNWIALFAAGMIGGALFVLKWLYHSVAKGRWHQDRLLWRLIVPINSAVVSLFTGFIFASGVIPFLKGEAFDDLYTLLGFGFIFGYFSDNILAALQNIAQNIFGTLTDK
ncbi:hypothetical protein [uncultured Litoreibacter sp.]|uniref:hypothetical protein n=1 Tax=uncultured Litoreibacter sp. TaxID=1392394 RepID=UPI0026317BD4|nr:hypothetical protein [uncultured Litoreibacter sp.]